MGFCNRGGWRELEPLIRAVFFDLGDTLIAEESMPGKHLWEAEALQKLPHLDEVLAELKQRGFKLGVITNTVTSREEHVRIALRKIDCEQYFDVVITSVDMGCNKPDEKIFSTALKRLGVKPEEAVMVGDRIETDIAGGNRIGIKTVLFRWNKRYPEKITSQEEKPTHRIKSLGELLKISDLAKKKTERAKKRGYVVRYVSHRIIADFNATYNVEYKGKRIITNAAKKLRIPQNEIWISEMWKPYEKYLLFHELREIRYRAEGLDPNNAHGKTVEDQLKRWKDDAEFQKMVSEIKKMDEKTAQEKTHKSRQKQ